MANRVALAIAAHPDDIEFMMGGTLLLLGQAGYELHYMNVANGSMGTATHTREDIIRLRTEEAREAAGILGATFHEPLVDDLDIYYDRDLPKQVGAVVRETKPGILLVQSPQDYMEDHINACRLAVSAAFFRSMRNFITEPPHPPIGDEVTVYHALPWGLRDPLRRRIWPGQYVDVSSVMATKREALACHKTQKEWLDASQGLDSYLITMEEMSAEVGGMAKKDGAPADAFTCAEGWRRHSHLGFCAEDADPLTDALRPNMYVSAEYEKRLELR